MISDILTDEEIWRLHNPQSTFRQVGITSTLLEWQTPEARILDQTWWEEFHKIKDALSRYDDSVEHWHAWRNAAERHPDIYAAFVRWLLEEGRIQ